MASNTIKTQPIITQRRQPQLKKAMLKVYDRELNNDEYNIVFMFNPTEISFTRTVKWESKTGNRGDTLLPKVNFSGVEPYKFTLKQLIFDTYETKDKESVMKYIDKIKKGVETIETKKDKRPPVYIFTWDREYFHCVITSLTYTLNMFLTDGTPVRAMVDISLQEVDKNNIPEGKGGTPKGKNRLQDPKIKSPK